jgi:hypothetical protein
MDRSRIREELCQRRRQILRQLKEIRNLQKPDRRRPRQLSLGIAMDLAGPL